MFTELSGTRPLAADLFKAKGTGTATHADDRIVYTTSTGALFYDAVGAGHRIQFAVLVGHPALTAADLLVV